MHELGIAEKMIEAALEHAARHQARHIACLHIEMSQAADESEDALRFHLENLARGTIAQGSQVEIRRIPLRRQCLDCSTQFDWNEERLVCPNCASRRTRVIAQDEFRLVSIDAE